MIMKNLLTMLFGEKQKNIPQMAIPSLKTTEPPHRPSFNKWCKEYNVSLMWNRDVSTHIE